MSGTVMRIVHRVVYGLDRVFDGLRRKVRDRLGVRAVLEIVPYRTFGTADALLVRGRVLVRTGRREPAVSDSWLHNVWRTVRRFLTYEMPDVEVRTRIGGHTVAARTDGEGYFRVKLPGVAGEGWLRPSIEVDRAAGVAAEVLVPPSTATVVVISDIDDTILPTGATRTATVLKTTLLGNALTRAPFPGIAEFYQALAGGSTGDEFNPVFYVSSSPWNLYDFMVDFMATHGLPTGPILLRDFGVDRRTFFLGRHDDHKLAEIRAILDSYPELPAVLIGDIGQRDPEIYGIVASEYPGRVRAIYLRDVGAARDVEKRALTIGDETGVPVVLAAHTSQFQLHAAGLGLVPGP